MQSADEAEFIAYAEGARGKLRQVAYLMCGDWERAEDAVQEALARLYVHWKRIDKTWGLRTYAHRTVVSAVLDGVKRPWWRERLSAQPVDEATPARRPDAPVEDRMVVVEALAALPRRQRACVVLRYYEDLSVGETADIMQVSDGTVKSQTARGLDALRDALLSRGYEPVPKKPASNNSEGIAR